MKHVRGKARKARLFIGLGMLLSLLIAMTGCWWLINVEPIAAFTASVLFGEAPLTVNFSAVLSYDPDGDIVKYEWDFGDGTSGDGMSVSHTYTVAGTLTVVLKVTDDGGKTDTAQKTIVVSTPEEPGGAGPYATFTATPLTGDSPLTVTFNAAGSYHPIQGYTITSYTWDFGDGTTGTGVTTSHTYATAVTRTYHVVLTVIASDNTQGTAEMDVIVTVPGAVLPPGGPTASFTADKTSGVGPFVCNFDPANSSAAVGHTIQTYFWTFEITGATITDTTGAIVQQTFFTSLATRNYTVTLIVIDDQALTGSFSRIIQVKNLQPVAGFEVEDTTNNGGVWTVPTTTTPLDIAGVGALPGRQTTVTVRSIAPAYPFVVFPNENESIKPNNFETGAYVAGDRNLSYDPEGYGVVGDGWGIKEYRINWGDGSPPVTVADDGTGGLPATARTYTLPVGNTSATFDIVVTAVDESDGVGSLTRRIVLHET